MVKRDSSNAQPGTDAPRPQAEAGVLGGVLGRVLDERYRIDAEIGHGGVGAVYRATHLKLGQPVAIKLLLPHFGTSPAQRVRFEREAKALASLAHPNIVAVTDYGVAQDGPYLVMELLEGQTLGARLAAGRLSQAQALELTRQILRALSFVHQRGLVHRDLKPGNVFLQQLSDGDQRLKLLDFGLAKFVQPDGGSPDATLTRAGDLIGTPAYMAPEQCAGDPADARTDVYAMGVILFEMLTGRTPFLGEPSELLRGHLAEPPPTLLGTDASLHASDALEALVARALQKSRKDRFADAAAMLQALDEGDRPDAQALSQGAARGSSREPPVHSTLAEAQTLLAAVPEEPPSASGLAPPSAAEPTTLVGLALELIRGVLRVGARMLTLIVLGLVLMIAGVSYVMTSPERTRERAALESFGEHVEPQLKQMAAAAPRLKEQVSAAMQEGAKAMTAPLAAKSAGTAPVETDPAKATEPLQPVAAAPAARAGKPAPHVPAKNPWARGTPKDLRVLRKAIMAGEYGSDKAVALLRSYSGDHLSDVRARLLLAHMFLNRRWRADALAQYASAYQVDPSCRGAPQMLSDVIDLATLGPVTDKAARLLREAYGREALGALERAANAQRDDVLAARLRALRARIAGE